MTIQTTSMNGLLECEFFDVESSIVGDTFRIFVAKPPFVQPGSTYPAIYAADGNTTFAQAMTIQRTLAWGAESPAAFVFGIGYPTERGFLQAIAKRNRDYVPSDGGDYARDVLRAGFPPGGAAFLRFIAEELKPRIAAHYAIDENDSTFIGASLSGLFGVWTLLTSPAIFQRYVLINPAIWWNDEEVWHWEEAFAQRHRAMAARVFLSAGGNETGPLMRRHALQICERNPHLRDQVAATIAWHDEHGWPRTAELMHEFVAKLKARRYEGLDALAQNLPDETHLSVQPGAMCRGLRYAFDSALS